MSADVIDFAAARHAPAKSSCTWHDPDDDDPRETFLVGLADQLLPLADFLKVRRSSYTSRKGELRVGEMLCATMYKLVEVLNLHF